MSEPLVNESNKQAWDRLYLSTPERVWGEQPLAFLYDIRDRILPNLGAGMRCLDAATGEGRNLPFFLETGSTVYGCDASGGALTKLKQRFNGQVQADQCDLAATPYPDDYFDLILMADVVETLPEAPKVLEEMYRITRPNGLILCNIPDEDEEIAGADMVRLDSHSYLYQDNYYYRFYNREQANKLMSAAGYAVTYAQDHTWTEAPHPEFRAYDHEHKSLVLIGRKQ